MSASFLQNYRGQNTIYRLITVSQLQASGDRSAVESLIWILNNDASDDVRLAAAEALGEIGDEWAINALWEAFVNPNKKISEAAMTALSKIDAGKKPGESPSIADEPDPQPEGWHTAAFEKDPSGVDVSTIPSYNLPEWISTFNNQDFLQIKPDLLSDWQRHQEPIISSSDIEPLSPESSYPEPSYPELYYPEPSYSPYASPIPKKDSQLKKMVTQFFKGLWALIQVVMVIAGFIIAYQWALSIFGPELVWWHYLVGLPIALVIFAFFFSDIGKSMIGPVLEALLPLLSIFGLALLGVTLGIILAVKGVWLWLILVGVAYLAICGYCWYRFDEVRYASSDDLWQEAGIWLFNFRSALVLGILMVIVGIVIKIF